MAAMFLAGGDKALALHVVFAIQAFMAAGIALGIRRIAQAASLRHWYVALPLIGAYFLTGMYGSEAHLNGLALVWALYFFLKALRDERSRDWAFAGALVGVAVLARLDNVFFAGTMFLVALVQRRNRGGWGRWVVTVSLPCVVLVLPYLLSNLAGHGHLMPISGAIKSRFPHPELDWGHLGMLGRVVTVGAAGALLATFWERRVPIGPALRALSLGVILHAAYLVLFTHGLSTWSWYHVGGVLNLALLGAWIADRLAPAMTRLRVGALHRPLVLATVSAMAFGGVGRAWFRYWNPEAIGARNAFALTERTSGTRWLIELAEWLDGNLPDGSGVLVYDGPGMLAYYSDLRILSLDGLISSYRYDEELAAKGAEEFLHQAGVEYFVGRRTTKSDEPATTLEIFTPLTRRPAGTLALSELRQIARTKEFISNPRAQDLAVWQLRPTSG